MKKPVSFLQLMTLNTYWVGLSFMWNALHPIILPAVLINYVPAAQKNTYLGLLTFAGLIIAMIVQPISGAISDGWRSRFGRRRPLIILGTLFDFVFLALLGWAGGLPWLFVGYLGLQFSSNIAHGPAQGLLPDRVPKSQLGVGSGVKTFLDMLSVITASLVAGNLLDPSGKDPSMVILVVMVLLAVSLLVTVLFTPEEPTNTDERVEQDISKRPGWLGLAETFRIDFRSNTSYWWLIFERFMILVSIYGMQQFVQYFIGDVLQVENPVQATGNIMAALAVGLVILSLVGGWLTDRFGAKRILVISSILIAVGSMLMTFVRSELSLTLVGSLVGGGLGLFLTANWTLASKLAPSEEAGKYLGLTNIATAGSAALGRLWGPILDWLNNAWPGMWHGYTAMFIFGGICALLSIPILKKVKEI